MMKTKKLVQKVSERLAEMADGMVEQSASVTFWGEVELPECMKEQADMDTSEK
ncbi:MAG: hypothetical protein MRZ36_04015 [Eubacterium sp.]|nr:hypothetical protein [Eubacterium sp.]